NLSSVSKAASATTRPRPHTRRSSTLMSEERKRGGRVDVITTPTASACGYAGVPSAAAALGGCAGVPSAAAALGGCAGVPTAAAALGWCAERSAARHQRKVAVGVGPRRQWKKVGGPPCGGGAAFSGEAGRCLLSPRTRSERRRGVGF